MTAYSRCRTCGRYFPALDTEVRGVCSKACVHAYRTCLNCGKYFLKRDGFDDDHCSKACTVKYVIQRKYGPQPVTILTEVY